MQETARGQCAGGKDLVIARANTDHFFFRDRAVVERRTPVWPALKYGEIADLVGNLAYQLNACGAGANHGHFLINEIDRLMRPVVSMERAALEIVDAFKSRHGRRGEQADRENHETARQLAAIPDLHLPQIARFIELHRLDLAVELHVPAQIELVGDVIEI